MRRIVLIALVALMASSAAAQKIAEPWHTPTDEGAPNRAHVTSGEDAAKASTSEVREAKALAVAVFAKPAAAQRATEKVEAANAPAIPAADPKPEWVGKEGLQFGGKGMKVTTPF